MFPLHLLQGGELRSCMFLPQKSASGPDVKSWRVGIGGFKQLVSSGTLMFSVLDGSLRTTFERQRGKLWHVVQKSSVLCVRIVVFQLFWPGGSRFKDGMGFWWVPPAGVARVFGDMFGRSPAHLPNLKVGQPTRKAMPSISRARFLLGTVP